MEIDEMKRNVNCLLAASGLRREEGEQPIRLLLYHLLMSASIYDKLAAEERTVVDGMQKKLKSFFSSKFVLKERKKRAEKKISPHTPFIKEKLHQKIDKENIYMAAGANSDFLNRLEAFRQECLRFVTEDNEQRVADFFNHYSQPSKRGKMLFEGKRYWDTEKRLKLWMNRSYNVDNNTAAERQERKKARRQSEAAVREQQRAQAAEREEAEARMERERAEQRKNAVSYEEYLAMKEKNVE